MKVDAIGIRSASSTSYGRTAWPARQRQTGPVRGRGRREFCGGEGYIQVRPGASAETSSRTSARNSGSGVTEFLHKGRRAAGR